MVDEMKIFDIGEAITEIADIDEDGEEILGLGGFGRSGGFAKDRKNGSLGLAADEAGTGLRVGKVQITDENFVRVEHNFAEDGFARESVGNAFAIIIDETVGFENEIIERGDGGFGENDRSNTLDILVRFVAQLRNLFKIISTRKSIKMKLASRAAGIGLDADAAELGFELGARANGNDAVVRAKVIIGVVFHAITAMNAIGDRESIKEDGIAGDFGKIFGRIKNQQMMIVGLFEIHDLGFNLVLAIAQSLAYDANRSFRLGGRRGLLEITNNAFEFVEVAICIFIKVSGFY